MSSVSPSGLLSSASTLESDSDDDDDDSVLGDSAPLAAVGDSGSTNAAAAGLMGVSWVVDSAAASVVVSLNGDVAATVFWGVSPPKTLV